MNNHVAVFCASNEYSEFDAAEWWKKKADRKKVILEYLKMINFYLFQKWSLA
jgi:hypothetical protein